MADRILLVMPGRLAARWWAIRTWPARRRARLASAAEIDVMKAAIVAELERGRR